MNLIPANQILVITESYSDMSRRLLGQQRYDASDTVWKAYHQLHSIETAVTSV